MNIIIFCLIILVVAVIAWYIITKFFPADIQQPALLIVGVILLIGLILAILPLAGINIPNVG